ncbi:MAG TPA: hypothetical protein VGN85_04580, partial [Methyloceanibacter sp.]|nr:hypothetical protein [Methyloceanibacter sp.]
MLEHDPEKWKPVFRKDHAPTKRLDHDAIHHDLSFVDSGIRGGPNATLPAPELSSACGESGAPAARSRDAAVR